MHWESVLSSTIEAAIGIAGFSGIVVAIRRGSASAKTDRQLLATLLTASAAAVLFSILPFVLADAELPLPLMWRIGSALFLVYFISMISYRQVREPGWGDAYPRALGVVSALVLILQVGNVVVLAESWPFVLAITLQLAVAFMAFVRLLFNAANGDGGHAA